MAGTNIAQGSYLDVATAASPSRCSATQTAQLLGIDRILPRERIWLCTSVTCPTGGQWFYVTGILSPVPATYAPEINTAVLVGFPAAEHYLGFDGHPSDIYVRTANDPPVTDRVDSLLAARPGRRTPVLSTSLSPRPHSPPRPTPRAPSTRCSSASARSR